MISILRIDLASYRNFCVSEVGEEREVDCSRTPKLSHFVAAEKEGVI
jgi:hypothetical protein